MGKIIRKTLSQIRRAGGGKVDRAKVLKTTDEDIARHIAKDPDAAPPVYTMQPVVDVKAIRRKSGMSQDKFARSLRIPAATVRNWEQGRRYPDAPALSLLRVFAVHPEAVASALRDRG